MVAMTATNFAVRTQPGLELAFLDGAEAGILCLFASSMSGIRRCAQLRKGADLASAVAWAVDSSPMQMAVAAESKQAQSGSGCVPAVRVVELLKNGTVCWAECDKRQPSCSTL